MGAHGKAVTSVVHGELGVLTGGVGLLHKWAETGRPRVHHSEGRAWSCGWLTHGVQQGRVVLHVVLVCTDHFICLSSFFPSLNSTHVL